jgi:hypothetical protein
MGFFRTFPQELASHSPCLRLFALDVYMRALDRGLCGGGS